MSSLTRKIENVTVVGGGLMGSGIAQVAASGGYNVTLVEQNSELIAKATSSIERNLHRVAVVKFKGDKSAQSKYVHDSIQRLKYSCDLNDAVKNSDLVIEAIIEDLKIKQDLFSSLDDIAPEHTIFASNTSSLSINDMASVVKRKDRFCGMHFFNPVPVVKLLEVIRADSMSEETYNQIMEVGKAMGKTCITCKDTPGFIVNRLIIPYTNEAMRMLDRGDATAKDIDLAMKLGTGHALGPIELLDFIGLDTTRQIMNGWRERFPDNPLYEPIPILEKLVEQGKYGMKSGEGFYNYKK